MMMKMSRLFETEYCQRLLAQLRVLGEKKVMIQKHQMYKNINILLMLPRPNFKEEMPATAIMCALQKVSSQGEAQTSLATKYELTVHFSHFQINWPSFSEDMQILIALPFYSHCYMLMENCSRVSLGERIVGWVTDYKTMIPVSDSSCLERAIEWAISHKALTSQWVLGFYSQLHGAGNLKGYECRK